MNLASFGTRQIKSMCMQNRTFRITKTLLSSWLYTYKTDNGYENFLKCLNRVVEPPSQAMLDGSQFEGLINTRLEGQEIDPTNKWYEQVECCAEMLKGSQKQVTLFRKITVNGVNFLLQGVLDFLKEGVIYDTKFTKNYELNKFLDCPQHSMYFALVPEASKFEYVICDGHYVYTETYYKEDTIAVEKLISQFMDFLDLHNLVDIYVDKWDVEHYEKQIDYRE